MTVPGLHPCRVNLEPSVQPPGVSAHGGAVTEAWRRPGRAGDGRRSAGRGRAARAPGRPADGNRSRADTVARDRRWRLRLSDGTRCGSSGRAGPVGRSLPPAKPAAVDGRCGRCDDQMKAPARLAPAQGSPAALPAPARAGVSRAGPRGRRDRAGSSRRPRRGRAAGPDPVRAGRDRPVGSNPAVRTWSPQYRRPGCRARGGVVTEAWRRPAGTMAAGRRRSAGGGTQARDAMTKINTIRSPMPTIHTT